MRWATRAGCHVDRAACAWLIRRFIDVDAEFVFVDDLDEVPGDATPFDMPGVDLSHRGDDCSFETILRRHDLDDPVLWAIAGAGYPTLERTRSTYDVLRADTVRQVAKLMAAAAITAPKSGGQLFLQGKHLFIETVIVDDRDTLSRLSAWMRARGKERRETIWFRDADVADAIDAVLFVGLADWYPPNYDCGACGYATCAEFLHATNTLREDSDELEFAGPHCNLRDIDLGIAVGSAAKTAAIHSIDCRCQTRISVAARKLGVIRADVAVALSLSLTHKAVGFDRRFPEVDFDALDLPPTNTLPVGVCRRRGPPRRHPQSPTPPRLAPKGRWGRPVIATEVDVFTRTHTALTGAVTGVIVLGFAIWRLRGTRAWIDRMAVALLAGLAVFLYRTSANLPQLNRDGLSGYSANDWLAPVVVFAVLTIYADLFPPPDPRRFRQVRAAATITAFVVNVVTI